MASTAVDNLKTAQEIELQQVITELQSNPDRLSGYISEKRDGLVNNVMGTRSNTFSKIFGDMVRSSNTQNNIYYYYVRNKDLDNIQKEMLERNKYDVGSVIHDKDVAQRQYQINEWAYNNKMDTLFVLQMILIAAVLLTPLLYLSRQGTVPTSVLTGVGILFAIIIVLTTFVRAKYTIYDRDQKFWNRRQFGKAGRAPPPLNCQSLEQAYSSASENIANLTAEGGRLENVGDMLGNRFTSFFSSA